VILVDANLVLYAEDSRGANYEAARAWWHRQLSGTETVGLSWIVLMAFIRIGTHPRAYQQPQYLPEAIAAVQSWFDQPCVRLIVPTDQHWAIFSKNAHGRKGDGQPRSDATSPPSPSNTNVPCAPPTWNFAQLPEV